MERKVYRCYDDTTREFLTEVLVMNARSKLEAIVDALYWRKRSMTKDVIIPCWGTISSWRSKILRGNPPDWMLKIIKGKPHLWRRYTGIVHRSL